MAEVLHQNLGKIEASETQTLVDLEKGKYILLSAHREENIDTEKNFTSLFTAINKMAEKYDMPILYSCLLYTSCGRTFSPLASSAVSMWAIRPSGAALSCPGVAGSVA